MESTNQLSNSTLLSELDAIAGSERKMLARMLVLLMEVDRRRLHLDAACPTLFMFCVSRLKMSEGEAYRRTAALRLVKRFPSLLERIERGVIHLTALLILKPYLTNENVDALVTAASGKRKEEVQKLVAIRF